LSEVDARATRRKYEEDHTIGTSRPTRNGASVRWGAFAIGSITVVTLAGCAGTSSKSSNPSQASGSPIAAPTTTTVSLAWYGQEYLALLQPLGAAASTYKAQAAKLTADSTWEQMGAIAAPFADALATFDADALQVAWPGSVEADVRQAVVAAAQVEGDLRSVGAQTLLSASAWLQQEQTDEYKFAAESNIARVDLGVPNTQG
jgi:hypothetical protein